MHSNSLFKKLLQTLLILKIIEEGGGGWKNKNLLEWPKYRKGKTFFCFILTLLLNN